MKYWPMVYRMTNTTKVEVASDDVILVERDTLLITNSTVRAIKTTNDMIINLLLANSLTKSRFRKISLFN